MIRTELAEIVYESLRELCENNDIEITDESDPVKDLRLDSEDGIEFACDVSQKIGKLLPNDKNPFIDDDNNSIRTVGMMIDYLVSIEPNLDALNHSNGE